MDNKRGAHDSSVHKAHLAAESIATNGFEEKKYEGMHVPLYPTTHELTEASKPLLRGPLMDQLDSTSLCSSATNSASNAASDAIQRVIFESDHQRQQLLDEEMGRIRTGSLYPSPLTAEAAAASHEDEELMFSIEIKPEQQHHQQQEQEQQSTEQFALDQHTFETRSRTNAADDIEGDDLVQATLIRDADETSHHSNTESEWVTNTNTTQLTRAISSAAVAVQSDIAVVEAKPVDVAPAKAMSRKLICAVMGMLLLVIAALSVGFVVSAQRQEDDSSNSSSNSVNDGEGGFTSNNRNATTQRPSSSSIDESLQTSSISPSAAMIPVLERLKQGGRLRCGVMPGPGLFHPNEGGEPFGFDAALCAAVAAAATGDPKNVDYIQMEFGSMFQRLHFGFVDILSAGITHTMERQIFQADAKAGFSFTVPYLYQGMQLAGEPDLVDCGDRGLEFIAACPNIKVCVVDESTHEQLLSSYLPGQKLIAINSREQLLDRLADGTCNVIAHEGYNLAEPLVREAGYKGDYKVGVTLFSKEPLAMVTSSGDPQFADFANSIVQSLVVAEFHNITQATANQFPQTDSFGEEYKDMFRNAIAAEGNYGEMYARYLEAYSNRQGLNLINSGTSSTNGLLYSHPFGSISTVGGEVGETVRSIKLRGRLRCGVRPKRSGFAELERNNITGDLLVARGMEIDYCKALAGSIFESNGNKIDYVEVDSERDGFIKLAAGDLDVLAGATWNFVNDVRVPAVGEGFSLTQPYFYGVADSFAEETLGLATRQTDHHWSSFVYWISAAIVQAEETNITQGMSNSMPPIYLFGDSLELMLQDAVLTVGNYGEMYQTNLESLIPRSGRNLLNSNSQGPEHFPLPGLI